MSMTQKMSMIFENLIEIGKIYLHFRRLPRGHPIKREKKTKTTS